MTPFKVKVTSRFPSLKPVMKQFLLLSLTLFAIAGCAEQNAILELEIDLPAPPDEGVWAVRIQARPSPLFSFEEDVAWGEMSDVETTFSSTSEPLRISIDAPPERFSSNLLVRAIFCNASECQTDTRRRRQLNIETPFYEGKRTRYTWEINSVPDEMETTTEVISRCRVGGCIAEDQGNQIDSYCRILSDGMTQGAHYCE